MKYALLVYDDPSSWHSLATEQRHAVHDEYHDVADFPGIIGHYRLRPPQNTTTVRVEEDQIVTTDGPLTDTRETFRAFYLLDRER